MKSKYTQIRKWCFLTFLWLAPLTFGQVHVKGTDYTHFQLRHKQDTIDFVVADTNLTVQKPLFLFCQGSQPVPLFYDFGEAGIFPMSLSNFDLEEMRKNYHVVVISMPHTPLIVGPDHLNKQYNYVTDTSRQNSYSVDYLKADYAENYVRRANQVIKYMLRQNWVKPDGLVVAGHSQGSRIAVSLAASNKKVTQLGLFGYNPMGRVEQAFRQARKDAEKGKISWEEADALQQQELEFYRLIQDEDSVKTDPGLVSWKSFSKSTLEQLTQVEVPVYIVYGSHDIVADYCDLIPLRFVEKGKNSLTIHRYPNLEHNFFPVLENGWVDHENGKWKEVMNAFVSWTMKNTAAAR